MWADVQAGRLPAEPTIEWYVHTTVDPSLQDSAGHHSTALFVQSVPYEIAGSSWDAEISRVRRPPAVDLRPLRTRHVRPRRGHLPACRRPGSSGTSGSPAGHIHHVDNAVAFADRMPYATGVRRPVRRAARAAIPAGSVIGAAGHNAANRILTDLSA